jgi:hypothetical protein
MQRPWFARSSRRRAARQPGVVGCRRARLKRRRIKRGRAVSRGPRSSHTWWRYGLQPAQRGSDPTLSVVSVVGCRRARSKRRRMESGHAVSPELCSRHDWWRYGLQPVQRGSADPVVGRGAARVYGLKPVPPLVVAQAVRLGFRYGNRPCRTGHASRDAAQSRAAALGTDAPRRARAMASARATSASATSIARSRARSMRS